MSLIANRRPAGLALLLTMASCHRGSGGEDQAEAAPKPLVTVKVATATAAEIDLAIRAPATIFPRERVSISSNLTTPIRALYARKGDKVAKNQLLALLEDRDLSAQKGEATAALRQAEVLRARRADLFAAGAIPQRELLATETELLQSRARLDRIEATLRFTELRSPFAGVIVDQLLYAGDVIRPDTPVFTVVDMSVAVARAQVPESEIAAVHLGQTATFTSRDEDSATGGLSGRISMINQAVDPARRTVEVWCEIDNKAGRLRDGTFGQLAIVTTARGKRVVVPRAAVLFDGDSKGAVMVVTGAKDALSAHKREVETGSDGADPVAVTKGLAAGDVVVVEGAYGLPDGTTVQVAPAAQGPSAK